MTTITCMSVPSTSHTQGDEEWFQFTRFPFFAAIAKRPGHWDWWIRFIGAVGNIEGGRAATPEECAVAIDEARGRLLGEMKGQMGEVSQ